TALSDFARAKAAFETQGLTIPAGFPVPVLSTNTIPILLRWLKEEPYEAPLWKRLCERAPLPQWLRDRIDNSAYSSGAGAGFQHMSRGDLALIGLEILGTNAAVAVPELVWRLKHERAEDASLSALICIGAPAHAFALDLAASTNRTQQRQGAHLLGALAIEPNTSVPMLVRLCRETSPEVRGSALTALAEFPEKAIDSVTPLLQDKESAMDAAYALSSSGTNIIPVFLNALIDSNRTVRVAALGALMFRETLTQGPLNLARRDSAYAGKRCLFNMQALQMAFFMYADKDQGELFDYLRKNYAQAGEPGMQAALKARWEKTRSGMQTIADPAPK
ncbi:MAG: hypothetical protein JWM99_3554, partial [Verrucomicrobiales bacterium]|nr:hypothetical protein [Verrucomicrobiales bacterium]